jgi:hypothetical protein
MKKLLILPLLVAVAACTTPRDDKTYSCEQLTAQYAANTKDALSKYGEGKSGFGAGNALVSQNTGVKATADRKGCDTKLWPAQPDKRF